MATAAAPDTAHARQLLLDALHLLGNAGSDRLDIAVNQATPLVRRAHQLLGALAETE